MNLLLSSSNAKHHIKIRILTRICLLCFLLLLQSCNIPQLRGAYKGQTLPQNFNFAVSLADDAISLDGTESSAQLKAQEFFDDPQLVALINQAIVGNQELKILAEEVQMAYNDIQARQGAYLPFVSLGGRAGIEKSSVFSRNGAVEENLQFRPGKAIPDPYPEFLAATNITWEIDIWRKLRNAKDAQCLRYLGTWEGRNYVVTRLVAEVAEKYYELLALDNRLEILDKTIEIQQQSQKVAQFFKDAGRGTELPIQRFNAEVSKNKSEKYIVQQEIVEVENRINYLCGRFPQPIDRPKVDYIDINLNALNTGVPSQLLRNRPDIRRAEREVQAAGLDIKVARAEFYPSLVITGDAGFLAFNTKYLLSTPDSIIYNFAGEMVAPLINKNAIQAEYKNANARQLQAIYDYQQTVINSFTEVINRVSKVENYGQSVIIKKQQLESLVASVDSATKLFQSPRAEERTEYIEVLLAQRDMMEAKMVLVKTKQEQLSAIVNAYQALGGGWK